MPTSKIRVLLINPSQERCGVFQYGKRMFSIMQMSSKLDCSYLACPDSIDIGSLYRYDVIIYNFHPGIPNAMHNAPFPISVKQCAFFHDGHHSTPFDLWLFSDSSAPGYGNLKTIGRPLPHWEAVNITPNDVITIGLSGLVGAWAVDMVQFVTAQLPEAKIRLHLAPSDHCDPTGGVARAVGEKCRAFGIPNRVEVDYDFKDVPDLMRWLSQNDLNCYIRSTGGGAMSISSALDMALACGRPIAVNNNPMFRHLTRLNPEILIENTPLKGIIALGSLPLQSHLRRNNRYAVMEELEEILGALAVE